MGSLEMIYPGGRGAIREVEEWQRTSQAQYRTCMLPMAEVAMPSVEMLSLRSMTLT